VREAGADWPEAGFRSAEEAAGGGLLTPREVDILRAVGEGWSNKEVARRLGISSHTVKFHLEAIFDKLGAGSRAEAVAKGLRRGVIEL
jgi:two-component system nitrate/nitrite response regulator NarL